MKKTKFIGLFLSILFLGCQKDEPISKVNEDGLTQEITDLVPQYILNAMDSLGMPIHGGETPPELSGVYTAEPFVLVSSNIATDPIGHQFEKYKVTFYEQDNDQLSIMVDYENGPEVGMGLGSYIVGDGDRFSVFVKLDTEANGGRAVFVSVISGTMGAGGIRDLFTANFMVEIISDPNSYFIPEGKGRVIYDEDGFSPRE